MDHRPRPDRTDSLREQLEEYVAVCRRAARAQLESLADMILAAKLGDALREAGIEIGPDEFVAATGDSLVAQYDRLSRRAMERHLVDPTDPVLRRVPR